MRTNWNVDPTHLPNKYSFTAHNFSLTTLLLQFLSPFSPASTLYPLPLLLHLSLSFCSVRFFENILPVISGDSQTLGNLSAREPCPKCILPRSMADQSILSFSSAFSSCCCFAFLPIHLSLGSTVHRNLLYHMGQTQGCCTCTDVSGLSSSLHCVKSRPFLSLPGPCVLKWRRRSSAWFRTLSTLVLNSPSTFFKFWWSVWCTGILWVWWVDDSTDLKNANVQQLWYLFSQIFFSFLTWLYIALQNLTFKLSKLDFLFPPALQPCFIFLTVPGKKHLDNITVLQKSDWI